MVGLKVELCACLCVKCKMHGFDYVGVERSQCGENFQYTYSCGKGMVTRYKNQGNCWVYSIHEHHVWCLQSSFSYL